MSSAATKAPRALEDWIAPDCHGLNFYEIDGSLRSLHLLYLTEEERAHMAPHFARLGELAGGRLDELARLSDRHVPVLHGRDSRGKDEDWIEFHPAYREMEEIGYGQFGIHCMSRRGGVLGWPRAVSPAIKYTFQYIFTQSEFGLMCPLSVTETSAMLIERYADARTRELLLPRMLSQDVGSMLKGTQFMTEKTGGSDVGNAVLEARLQDGQWRLYGEKWFCSCADADVALLLARPEGAAAGAAGLALFALPRRLEDGTRNSYRIVRLKNKLGSRSMASGEIVFNGALVYPLGEVGEGTNAGLKQMLDQVNMSRISHGLRAAGMMRRCLNEAMVVARSREAFGGLLIDKPLMRRQLMKLLIPTEQVLSMCMFAAQQLERADSGDKAAAKVVRILTPLIKFRSARDNIAVATGAMEVRGGNGYIEDWVNARLVRDSHLGVLWEGTSNINALDVLTRAVAKSGAHKALGGALGDMLEGAQPLPGQFRGELAGTVERAVAFATEVAENGDEAHARQASNALYHAASAVLLACEGARLGGMGEDARRLLMARMVVEHRLRAQDPMRRSTGEGDIQAALLDDAPIALERAVRLAAGS